MLKFVGYCAVDEAERQEELYPLRKETEIGIAVSDCDYIRRNLAACDSLVGGAGLLAHYDRPEAIETNRLFRVKWMLVRSA